MMTLAKLAAAGLLSLCILSPGQVEKCECEAKTGISDAQPRVDSCECEAKTPS